MFVRKTLTTETLRRASILHRSDEGLRIADDFVEAVVGRESCGVVDPGSLRAGLRTRACESYAAKRRISVNTQTAASADTRGRDGVNSQLFVGYCSIQVAAKASACGGNCILNSLL